MKKKKNLAYLLPYLIIILFFLALAGICYGAEVINRRTSSHIGDIILVSIPVGVMIVTLIRQGVVYTKENRLKRTEAKEVLIKYSKSLNSRYRVAVAMNRNTPTDLLCALAFDSNIDVRLNALYNPNKNFDRNTYARLAVDKDELVRAMVATDEDAPTEALMSVMHDENPDIRRLVAQNPNTTAEQIAVLCLDESFKVREVAAEKIKIIYDEYGDKFYDELYERLIEDDNVRVRTAAALNPNAPSFAREILLYDEEVLCYLRELFAM